MAGLYDEDGIDGPWEKRMAQSISNPKLSKSQQSLLFKLGAPDDEGRPATERRVKGRGALASAQVLRRYGCAEFVRPGHFNGEYWRITSTGQLILDCLLKIQADHEG